MSLYDKRPQQAPEQGTDLASTSARVESKNVQTDLDLQRVPVEEVSIQPLSRLVFHTDPRGRGADRFRFLRMRLRELSNARKVKRLLITSALPQDGKSTIALNLATALAERGTRAVLLLEADLHQASLSQQLGLKARPGLAECLEGGLDPMSALRRIEPLSWYFLPAGEPHSNATELLQSEALSGIMDALSPRFDWILVDSPPVNLLTDALSFKKQTDASLLVARAGRTPVEAVEEAIGLLGRDHVFSIVLNGAEGLDRLYSKYYGNYGYYGRDAAKDAEPAKRSDGSAARLANVDRSASMALVKDGLSPKVAVDG